MSFATEQRHPLVVENIYAVKFALSSASATVAELVTLPMDVTKTRMQIADCTSRPSAFHTARGIVQHEGVVGLWQGLSPAITRHIIYSGCRMSIYEQLKYKVIGVEEDGSFSTGKAAVAGLIAGALGQLIASPTDLVKVQMQTQAVNGGVQYRHVFHALTMLRREHGILGLWRGCVPNVQRAALIGLGDIAMYDTAKQVISRDLEMGDNIGSQFLASLCSGFCAAALGTPADVIKTRIMNQRADLPKHLQYRGAFDCLCKTVAKDGVTALWRGFFPIWLRMAPWSITFWAANEQLRSMLNLRSF